jgi:hypothetical protein
MIQLNYVAIAVAAVAVFIIAAVYYGALATELARHSPPAAAAGSRPRPSIMALELVRALIVATVVGALVAQIGITDVVAAVTLGLALWIAFPAVLLLGSVVHEQVPVRLAAIHGGDWLVKLVVIAVIVSQWR